MIVKRLPLLMVRLPLAHVGSVPATWSLAGQWRVYDANDSTFDGTQASDGDWRTLRVPANWYSAGYDHQGVLQYRYQFTLYGPSPDAMVTLVFDGVDYFAEVTFDGKTLARYEGYFRRSPADISGAVRRHNQLVVRADSPYEDPQKIWPLYKTLMKGILNQCDTRPGGAWLVQRQDANSGGIWASMKLHLSRGVTIGEVILRPDWQQGLEQPMLRAEIRYRAVTSGPVTLRLTVTPDNSPGPRFHQAFAVTLEKTAGVLHVPLFMPPAKLWRPVGAGRPNLYRVCTTLTDNWGMMDTAVARTGLHKAEALVDNQGWRTNDRWLFIKGSNYIGSPRLSIMTRKKYRWDFRLVTAMNTNAIRIHGHTVGRALYEVADRMGLMIWQDVPLQWGYDDSAALAENVMRQTRAMMDQFGNSLVVIVWGGHNEPPWNSPWMEKRFPDWRKTLNQILTQRVGDALAEDTSRIVHRFSAVEEHYWAGWYFGTLCDLLVSVRTGIITEFGAQALPWLSTLRIITPAHLLWPKTTTAGDLGWV